MAKRTPKPPDLARRAFEIVREATEEPEADAPKADDSSDETETEER